MEATNPMRDESVSRGQIDVPWPVPLRPSCSPYYRITRSPYCPRYGDALLRMKLMVFPFFLSKIRTVQPREVSTLPDKTAPACA